MPETVTVDARRLLCPLPVIRVQQAIAKQTEGTILTAYCTDPGALQDVPAWARVHGHTVLDAQQSGHEYIIVIQKKPNPEPQVST